MLPTVCLQNFTQDLNICVDLCARFRFGMFGGLQASCLPVLFVLSIRRQPHCLC